LPSNFVIFFISAGPYHYRDCEELGKILKLDSLNKKKMKEKPVEYTNRWIDPMTDFILS
jgi:hypothetical protein